MTNANEMAQKGFDTGFTDANDNELHVGDYVRICGHIGKIVFSCGAFGIFIADEVPWDALEELVRKDSGNRPSFLYNDTFISFWEIVWNLSEDTDEPCLPYVESITVTGGIFTDENGNKDKLFAATEKQFDQPFSYADFGTRLEEATHGYVKYDKSMIVSKDETTVNRIADMLDSMGFDAVTGYFNPEYRIFRP